MIDLDNTEQCPRSPACEVCGTPSGLEVVTGEAPMGVYCLTECGDCIDADKSAPAGWGWADLSTRIAEHAGHLGIDLDQMGALLAAESYQADERY